MVAEPFYTHLQQYPEQHILFINDGSFDESQIKLDEMQKAMPLQISSIQLSKNQGKAEAIRQGFLQALQTGNYDFVGYLDADLATPLDQVDMLCQAMENEPKYLLSFGSRVQLFGHDIQRKTMRHYLGRIFATYVSILFGLTIYDTQCGAKFFRINQNTKLIFANRFTSKWFFDIEVFLRLQKLLGKDAFSKSIIEIPLEKWAEQGDSKLKWSDFLTSPIELQKIKKNYRI
jgi:glycosyltransferase involved in cell wall biosynthesis